MRVPLTPRYVGGTLILALALALAVGGGLLLWNGRPGDASSSGATRNLAAPLASASPSPFPGAGSTGPDAVSAAKGDSVPGRRLRAHVVAPALVPVSVRIPAIGVTSSLVKLGIAGNGSIQVPADFQRAGWLTAGPAPGERGPAVIAGHVDSRSGPAIFSRLDELRPGDAVLVRRKDGTTVTFTVDGSQRVAKNRFPTATVYGPVPGPVLRLITCGGSFDHSTGHYHDNVVVYASQH
jgi:hypothetical protein